MKRVFSLLLLAALMLPISCSEPIDDQVGPEPGVDTPTEVEPLYKVGDYFKEGLAKGIVVAIDDETGTSGLLMSLDEAELMWSTEYEIVTGAVEVSMEDGHINCESIKSYFPDWAVTYPAIAWCSKKNPGSLTSWYLPAGHEIENIWNVFHDNKSEINATLVENGGAELSFGASDHYWSSTDAGPAIAYAYSFETGEIDYYACDKMLEHRVRCVRKFKVTQ